MSTGIINLSIANLSGSPMSPAEKKARCENSPEYNARLIAFLPTHIYMITDAEKLQFDGAALPAWAAWARLLIIYPILIGWAW